MEVVRLVGVVVGIAVGLCVGVDDGVNVGFAVGTLVGKTDGWNVGLEGANVGGFVCRVIFVPPRTYTFDVLLASVMSTSSPPYPTGPVNCM